MFSEKDFERLWFLYKTEGEPNGVSHQLVLHWQQYSIHGIL